MLFFSTGRAAHDLRTTPARIRLLCDQGLIKASQTRRGHFRISSAEIERIKAEGLPANPGNRPDESPKVPAGLYAPPSSRLAAEADEVATLKNSVQRSELQLAKEQADDSLTVYQLQKRLAEREAILRRNQQQAQLASDRAAQEWQEWADECMGDAPAEYVREADRLVRKTLRANAPVSDDPRFRTLVLGAIEKAFKPWRYKQAIEKIIQESAGRLSYNMKRQYCDSDRWELAVKSRAAEKIRALPAECSTQEAEFAAARAVEEIKREFEDEKHRTDVIEKVSWNIHSNHLEEATAAVKTALQGLPAGAGKEAMEKASDAALAPFLQAQKAEALSQRQDNEARQKLANAEMMAAIYLVYAHSYVGRLLANGLKVKASLIDSVIHPALVETILAGQISGANQAQRWIEEQIDKLLDPESEEVQA